MGQTGIEGRTESARVREFLATRYAGVKLVFSTYQSAHVVAAGMKRGESFDLAIFDEAHKTAGREGVHFGFALSDRHLRIKKRLFFAGAPIETDHSQSSTSARCKRHCSARSLASR